MAQFPGPPAQRGMTMPHEGELTELRDGSLAQVDGEPPPKRPSANHRDHLRIEELRHVDPAQRAQRLSDGAPSIGPDEQIDGR